MRSVSTESAPALRSFARLGVLLALVASVTLSTNGVWAETNAPSDPAPVEETFYDVGDDPLFDDEDDYAGDGLEPDPLFDEDFDLDLDESPTGFPDPLEKLNRGLLVFNQTLDRFVMDPITVLYRFILPEMVRRGINRVFDNVNSTQSLVNDIFQLEWTDAGVTTARLLINSTVGIGGLFDPAERWGLERHVSDFGQTLAIAGAPSGPYFMIPLLGPSNVRDGIGLGVDAFFHPTFFVLGGTDVLFFAGSTGLTERARYYNEIKALEESSIDYYAALRSGYYQNRQAEIWSRREDRRPKPDDPPAVAANAPAQP